MVQRIPDLFDLSTYICTRVAGLIHSGATTFQGVPPLGYYLRVKLFISITCENLFLQNIHYKWFTGKIFFLKELGRDFTNWFSTYV
jgi:hypothetical protein